LSPLVLKSMPKELAKNIIHLNLSEEATCREKEKKAT
jgi:hypothetical protein